MDIICEQATYCSLHWSDLSYYKKTLWSLLQWQVIQLTLFSAHEHQISFLWRWLCLPNPTRTTLLWQTQSHTHTGTFSSPKATENFQQSCHFQYSCTTDLAKKSFRGPYHVRADPSAAVGLSPACSRLGKAGGAEGSFASDGCLGQQCEWCVQNSSGISREILQEGENFWLQVPCHVLLGVIFCKLLAYGPLSFSFCQKMSYLSLQTPDP